MSGSPSFESPPTTLLDIINKIINKINYFILYSSSSSSSYTETQWMAFESLFNPQNEGFTKYLFEHKAFTLNQITHGSGIPPHQCRYIIDKLVNADLLTASSQAQEYKKPHIIYLVKGEDPKYVNEALKLHLDSLGLGGQLSLDNIDDWENLFVNGLEDVSTTSGRVRHFLKEIKRAEIVQDYMKQHPEIQGYNKETVNRVTKKLEAQGWVIMR